MKKVTIRLNNDIINETSLKTLDEALKMIGVTKFITVNDRNGTTVVTFNMANNETMYRMLKCFLVDEFGESIEISRRNAFFDFEDYIDTDLDGSSIETETQEMLLSFDTLIDKVLAGATTEFKRQARVDLGRLVKENVDRWIENNESIHP
jgi:hypothetical protein